MRIFAYCAKSFDKSVQKAAGARPLLSPPITWRTFSPHLLTRQDFIYFKLHGLEGQEFWYGDNWTTALSADQIRQADLTGAVVFVANCHLYELHTKPDIKIAPSAMLTALLKAGAKAIVGGAGENYANKTTVHGADKLGQAFRIFLQYGLSPQFSFKMAKLRIRALKNKDTATLDTIAFRLFEQEEL